MIQKRSRVTCGCILLCICDSNHAQLQNEVVDWVLAWFRNFLFLHVSFEAWFGSRIKMPQVQEDVCPLHPICRHHLAWSPIECALTHKCIQQQLKTRNLFGLTFLKQSDIYIYIYLGAPCMFQRTSSLNWGFHHSELPKSKCFVSCIATPSECILGKNDTAIRLKFPDIVWTHPDHSAARWNKAIRRLLWAWPGHEVFGTKKSLQLWV